MARNGVTVYLPRDLDERVKKLARTQHRSESSLVADAVKAWFDRGANAVHEETARRQISRVDGRLSKAIGETLIVKEALLLFIRVWLEHTPPLDETEEDAAAQSAEARFQRLLDLLAHSLSSGRSHAGAVSAFSSEAPFTQLTNEHQP
jgi:predicted transcriptional regulator